MAWLLTVAVVLVGYLAVIWVIAQMCAIGREDE